MSCRVWRTARRRRGGGIAEALASMLILGVVLSFVFQSLSGGLMTIEGLKRLDVCHYGVQWWFSRLPRPVSEGSFSAMPEQTPDGSATFAWEVRPGEHGALTVSLQVRARGSSVPFFAERTF